MSKNVTFAAFSCTHCPVQDEEALAWLLLQLEELKPDRVIMLGDLHEGDPATRWPSEEGWTYVDEIVSANRVLEDVRTATPDSLHILLKGNHDDNFVDQHRIDKKIRSRVDPFHVRQYDGDNRWINEEVMTHWHIGAEYDYHRTRGVYRIGQVTFAHGYEAGQSGDKFQAVTLGLPYGLYVGGHTHRPTKVEQVHLSSSVPLPRWHVNAGCMCEMDRHYMKRKRQHQWGQALVVGEAKLLKSPRLSRCWEAETRVFRMFGE